ncbi:MAG: hypothetical protein LKE64_11925 [Solobacterium sp.]|jgi:Trk K+ transport system NAD-binding subunit|nr:hypothetical protein [Solobacterium sp.]MCH4047965.1 hypothetical protein [Solobacterium sp.]MCH4075449.1 hypothetical protein [Solobacterium sp.]MCI1314559.1 hypothetical protein [Solobacterium sp.]MCI1346768.1 hypothetical protein [Solobacterium sp.]
MKKTALIPAYCPDGTMIDVIQDLKAESFDIAVAMTAARQTASRCSKKRKNTLLSFMKCPTRAKVPP